MGYCDLGESDLKACSENDWNCSRCEHISQYNRAKVVENYYRASNALMEIGTTKNIPEDLKELTIKASLATIKIIEYINTHRVNEMWSKGDE